MVPLNPVELPCHLGIRCSGEEEDVSADLDDIILKELHANLWTKSVDRKCKRFISRPALCRCRSGGHVVITRSTT